MDSFFFVKDLRPGSLISKLCNTIAIVQITFISLHFFASIHYYVELGIAIVITISICDVCW